MTTPQGRRSRAQRLIALAPFVVRTTPWVPLLGGCVAGTALLDLTAHVMHDSHGTVDQNTLRLTFLTAVAALAFVPRAPMRPITQVVATPSWIVPVGQTLMGLPVVALTAWLQMRIVEAGVPARARPTIYPLLAELVAWCCIAIATATCTDRTRYADLGGMVAVPLTFALIAIAWYTPGLRSHLVVPPASPTQSAIGWYVIAAIAIVAGCVSLRDPWQRYTRRRRASRLS
jgi:hypothetical protein